MKSNLEIEVASNGVRSYLQSSFVMPPFKIANITENKFQPDLHLMVMSSSPGVLDKDEYNIRLVIKESSSLFLQTQSFQRIFPMQHGAVQNVKVLLEKNARLVYLPHPAVPHKDAIFSSHNEIRLNAASALFWGEIVTCGRLLHDEVFQFRKFHSVTRIFIDGKLMIRENLLLQPGSMNLRGIGHLEGFTHQAGLIYIDKKDDMESVKEKMQEVLREQANISFGISRTPGDGLLLRILGYKAEQLFQCLQTIAGIFAHVKNLAPQARQL